MNNNDVVHDPEPDETDYPSFNVFTSGIEPLNRSLHPTSRDLRRWTKRRRIGLLEDLITNMDMLTYAQLGILYLLDNSFTLFVLRGLIQLIYLPPWPLPANTPGSQPFVGGIIGVNLLAIIYHGWASQPDDYEVTRGFIHGSLMLDFIGQKGPTSKLHLMGLDLVLLLTQAIVLASQADRRRLSRVSRQQGQDMRGTAVIVEAAMQDHDAEERGLLRRDSASSGVHAVVEQDAPLLEDTRRSRQHVRYTDPLYSGRYVVAELLLFDVLRAQHVSYMDAVRESALMPFIGLGSSGRTRHSRWRFNIPFQS